MSNKLLALYFLLGMMLLPSLTTAGVVTPRSVLKGAHGDKKLLPRSCQGCHRGMLMALNGEEGTCLACHGDSQGRNEMISKGLLKQGDNSVADIGFELRKPYNHPVLSVRGVHRRYEALPEEVQNAARHSECVDCHNPHVVEKGAPLRGVTGRRVINFVSDIQNEYELCYKCHAESVNLPAAASNKAEEFRTTNPSFHPVEGEGRSAYVVSLKYPYMARAEKPGDRSIISCRDCHGNDNPSGPKGPHGSNFPGLLVANYEMQDGRPESESEYALCYKCHDRASILANESFPYHTLHIEGDRAVIGSGTSCYTCHDSHGSSRYANLIRFNEDVVSPNQDGKLEFKQQGVATRHGSCLLNCHGVEHNPKEY